MTDEQFTCERKTMRGISMKRSSPLARCTGLCTGMIMGAVLAMTGPGTAVAGGMRTSGSAPQQSVRQPALQIQEFKLKNGLKVLIVEQHHAPVVTLNVTYNVGSRDEKQGRTGFAHLFEHMMFQGSANVGKAEHFMLVNNYGGTMNGTTSMDRTNYFQTVPANQLDLVLFLESDRMRSLDISQANLDNQRNAVQEERRLRYDNRPYGLTFEKLLALGYDNFAYKHSTIGSMADLNAASLEDVSSFFRTYYAPNNATLVLVGDVKASEALARVEKFFGDIPPQAQPALPDLTEKLDKGERRDTYTDPQAPQGEVAMIYPTVAGNHQDYFALDLALNILCGSESSRLYQRLVKSQELASDAGCGAMQIRGPGAAYISATVAPGKSGEEVEKVINEEVAKLQSTKVSEEELKRARTTTRAGLISQMETSIYLALRIGEMSAYYDDPNFLSKMPGLYAAVTAEDVQRVANTYLKTSNRGLLMTLPGKAPQGADAKK